MASSNQLDMKIEHKSVGGNMQVMTEIVPDQIASWSESDVIIEPISDDLEEDVEVGIETTDLRCDKMMIGLDLESRVRLAQDADEEGRLAARKIVGATAGNYTNEIRSSSSVSEGFNIVTLDAFRKQNDSQNSNDYDYWKYFEKEESVDTGNNSDVEKCDDGRELIDITPTINSTEVKEILLGDRRSEPIVRCEVYLLPYRQTSSYQNLVKRNATHPHVFINKCIQLHGNWKAKCHECGERFRDTTKLGNHMTTHTGRRLLNCNHCPKIFTSRALHRKYLREHYVCCECDKGFTSFFNLRVHERTHTEQRSYRCSYCSKPFRSKYQMHVRMHTNEKPYACSACDKSFITSHRLKVHESIHTGKRPYKCPYCSKTFVSKYNCKVHEIVHTNDTPHLCCECGKGFVSAYKLRAHGRVHIKNPFKCCYCPKMFASEGRRGIHEKKHEDKKPEVY